MKPTPSFKKIAVEIICYLYILLFVYAAVSKLIDYENFEVQIGQSPLLSVYAKFVSIGVLVMEILIAVILSIRGLRILGLYLAFNLMIMFTAYIVLILNYTTHVPCSCGGILEDMGWNEHLWFNICFIILAAAAILYTPPIESVFSPSHKKLQHLHSRRNKIYLILASGVLSSTILILLFLASERRMHRENPFIRRYVPGAATKTAETSLPNPYYYIAGEADGKIYLANHKSPLYMIEVDTTLTFKRQLKITLDRYDFPFHSAEIRIAPPYFYLYDGMVPVIYRGLVANFKATVIQEGSEFFTGAVVMDTSRIAVRGLKQGTSENIMALLNLGRNQALQKRPLLLQKQMDGFFDTSGTMSYSPELEKLVYVYYFRNQYIVADNDLQVQARGKTIDTTSRAQLKIVKITSSGDTKLAAPTVTVNKNSTVSGNLLFIHSGLFGQYEIPEVWDTASIVDVYDFKQQDYLLSFYVYDTPRGTKMKNFHANNRALYTIVGNTLQKYSFGNVIKEKNSAKKQ